MGIVRRKMVRRKAGREGADWILTTGKDAERLRFFGDAVGGPQICIADLEIEWNEANAETDLRDRLRALARKT